MSSSKDPETIAALKGIVWVIEETEEFHEETNVGNMVTNIKANIPDVSHRKNLHHLIRYANIDGIKYNEGNAKITELYFKNSLTRFATLASNIVNIPEGLRPTLCTMEDPNP